MTKVPTPEETSEAILGIMRSMNVRAGEVAPLMAIQQRLGVSYRAEDLNAALDYMQQAGFIEAARPGFVTLTQVGYGPEPGREEIQQALFEAIGNYGIRAGEAVPTQPIAINLMQKGYKGDEIADALEALTADGSLEMKGSSTFLTEKGFDAI